MSDKEELAGWIDTEVIAERILEELADNGIPATLDNGKAVWLDFLETELSDGIRYSVKFGSDSGKLK
jgi:hypothetical protein